MPDRGMTATQSLGIEQFWEELDVPLSTAYKWSAAGGRSGRFPRHTKLPDGRVRILVVRPRSHRPISAGVWP